MTSSTACGGCSPSRSGTRRRAGCCWPGTGWARSRCTGGTTGRHWSSIRTQGAGRRPAFGRRIDPVALHHYLTYQYVPAPWSIYQGIQKLPPGHLLSWQDGVTKVSRYWRLDSTQREVTSIPEAAEQLRCLLLDATEVRLLSERPLGAFLSGGIDSSAVVAAMARQTSGPVKTFSIGFENAHYDERAHARRLAEFCEPSTRSSS